MNNSVRRALREGALWVFGMLAVIFLVSLISYSTVDPGFRAASDGSVDNAIGPAGAWLADFFLLLFGQPAFLFPVMLAYAGFLLFQARDDTDLLDQATLWFRGLGFLVTLVTSCGLATLHFSNTGLPHTAGGILGDAIGQSLSALLSFLGATLLLLAVWLAGVSL
ncbi:MAG: DNA translocase FtsK 4TM domain-containing protein, partial [Gammaproteobacteria bacterium]|nr:DNA translocase FtsK 4TM domain-containing protein [Gammaproteobacteria bacterium]